MAHLTLTDRLTGVQQGQTDTYNGVLYGKMFPSWQLSIFTCTSEQSTEHQQLMSEARRSDVTAPLRLIGWGGAVNQELVDQWWRLNPPWFTWNSNCNFRESKRRTWKQEQREKQQKHTKNKNMSRKCLRAEKTEKYNKGKHDYVRKSDNFAWIFKFCAIWF